MNESVIVYSGNTPILDLKSAIVMSEAHTAENDIVEQTLEDGSPMTDHIVVKPDYIEIAFVISNVESVNGISQPLTGERAKTVWQELKRIRNKRLLVTVLTVHELYENMAIESLTGTHEAPTYGQLSYNIKLKKIDITNFNLGSNSPRKFSTKKFVPRARRILESAVDIIDKGFVNPLVYEDIPVRAKDMIEGIVLKGQIPLAELEARAKALADAKRKLESGMAAIRVLSDQVFSIQSFINGVMLKFTTFKNALTDTWSIDIENPDGMSGLIGVPLFRSTNLLEGYLSDLPIKNLFVSKKYNEDREEIFYLYYFDDEDLENFEAIQADLIGSRPLNFSLEDTDYIII